MWTEEMLKNVNASERDIYEAVGALLGFSDSAMGLGMTQLSDGLRDQAIKIEAALNHIKDTISLSIAESVRSASTSSYNEVQAALAGIELAKKRGR